MLGPCEGRIVRILERDSVIPAASRIVALHLATIVLATGSSVAFAEPEPRRVHGASWLLEQRFERGPLARLRAASIEPSPSSALASVFSSGRRPLLGHDRAREPFAALARIAALTAPVPAGALLLSPATPDAETWARVQQQVLAASGGGGCICAGDRADLDLTKSDAPDPLFGGGILVYTLDVTNFGPNKAGAVTVVDTLPAGVTFSGVVPGPPTCNHVGGTVTCDLGFLDAGAQQAIQISVAVDPGLSGTIVNIASLGALTFDPVASNDGDSESTTVLPPSPGQIPDGSQGVPLRISRNVTVPGDLDLSWGASCSSAATDYSIHEGSIGSWYSHDAIVCSTGGGLSATITPSSFDAYYLVVPISPDAEGSYGLDSVLAERPASSLTCRPEQSLAACP